MEIKCDHCGVVAETIMPETVKDGEVEHTFFRCPDCGVLYPISATDTMLRVAIAEYSRRRQMIRIKSATEIFLRETEALKHRQGQAAAQLELLNIDQLYNVVTMFE